MKTRIISILLAVCLIFGLLPASVLAADPVSGSCGKNATWSYNAATKTLSISGSGDMTDYETDPAMGIENAPPWDDYREEIEHVIINEGITSIGAEAFGFQYTSNCYSNLSSVSIAPTVTKIGSCAFTNAEKLKSIDLPNVTSIGYAAFNGTGIQSLMLPSTLETFEYEDSRGFLSCGNLQSITVDPGNQKYRSVDGVLFAGNKLLRYPAGKAGNIYTVPSGTTWIATSAFADNENITTISIPSSVSKIDSLAFEQCSKLAKITIAEGVTRVASDAFWGTALTSIVLPASVNDFTTNWGTEPDVDYLNRTFYFTGTEAPEFDTYCCNVWSGYKVVICYPENATGWDAVRQQDNVKYQVEAGVLEFKTGTPPTEPSDPTDELKLVSTSPASDATVTEDDSLVLTFNQELSKNLNWTKGSICIKNYNTDETALKIDSAKFYALGGTVNGKTLTIPGVFKTLVLGEYYVLIDADVIVAFVNGNVCGYGGITHRDTLKFKVILSHGNISFDYASMYGGDRTYSGVFYNDQWFWRDATKYNHELAKMTLGMAMAGFPSNEKNPKDANIKALYSKLKFDNEGNYYSVGYDNGDNDTVAMAISSKEITNDNGDTCTLIAVCLRGGGYGISGWMGNFNVGNTTAYHHGFNKAAEYAKKVVLQYIDEKQINTSNLRIWLTGYSRSAATANRLSKKLVDANVVNKKNIFTYTFATPNNQLNKVSVVNDSTFNIVNPLDIVPQVPLTAWGFGKTGTTYVLPYNDDALSVAEKWLIATVSKAVPSRDLYYGYIESPLMAYVGGDKTAFDAYFNGHITLEEILKAVSTKKLNEIAKILPPLYRAIKETPKESPIASILSEFTRLLQAYVDNPRISVNSEETNIIFMLTDIAVRGESSAIFSQHWPEQYLSQLMNYNEEALIPADRFDAKLIVVACPVDVRVYDKSSNELLAEVVQNAVNKNIESNVQTAVIGGTDKTFILPTGRDYSIEIIATDTGEMDFSVYEMLADTTIVRSVEFYDVKLTPKKVFNSVINNTSESRNDKYVLTSESHTVYPDYDSLLNGDTTEKPGLINTIPPTKSERSLETAFCDISKTDYFYDAVLWAVENGITTGTSKTRFSPYATCTRAQAVTFLWRSSGSPAPKNSRMPFADVSPSAYYYDAVLWALEKGITTGTSSTTFSPDAVIDRAQAVTLLYRANGAPSVTGRTVFTDVPQTAYYADAVKWAVNHGITTGTSAAAFSPNASCTRAQIVTFLYRAYRG